MDKNTDKAYLGLHLAVLIAGGTGLFGRLLTIGELPLVCYRVILAAIILAMIMGIQHRLHKLPAKLLLQIAGCGIILSVHWVFFFGSIKASNVSIGAVCFALTGFFTALIEPLLGKHRLDWKELLLGVLTVAGISLVFGFDPRYRLGIGLGVVSSLLYSFFSIFSKRVQSESGESSSTMLLYELIGGGIILAIATPVYALAFPEVSVTPTTQDAILLVLFASVFTIIPFLLQLHALRHISAFTVNLTYNLEPVYTIFFAMLLFNEASELGWSFWAGIVLIIASVALQARNMSRE